MSDATFAGTSHRPPWLPALASSLLALCLYCITIGGRYIYDDVQIVGVDPRLKSPASWGQIWTKDYFNGGVDNLYRPLVTQSYAIQWWLHGDQPWAFHLVNLILNAGVCALVAELGRRLAGWRVGLLAGLLFAVHPVHAEAVAGIVGRAELMCGLGMLGAMVLFLRAPMTYARAVAIWLLCVLALLSKEQGMLMPLLLLVLVPVRKSLYPSPAPAETLAERKQQRQPMQVLVLLLVWTVSAFIVIREDVLKLRFEWERHWLDFTIQPMVRSIGIDRWLMPVALIGRYLAILIAPIHLSIDYGYAYMGWTVSPGDPYLYLGIAVIFACLIAAGIFLIRRKWSPLFCLLALAITYSMAANIIIIGTNFGERLIYLPSIFFVILAAMAIERLPKHPAHLLIAFLLVAGCGRTFAYIRQWNDQYSFYVQSLRDRPESIRLRMLVGSDDVQRGDLDDARKVIADACAIAPDYDRVWLFAAQIEEQAMNWRDALRFYQRAYDLAPSNPLVEKIVHASQMLEKENAATRQSTKPSATLPSTGG